VRAEPGSRSAAEVAPADFYRSSLSEAERAAFDAALLVEGIDQEVAVLRTRLRQVAGGDAGFALLLKGLAMLVRMLATKYRLAPAEQDQVFEAAEEMLAGLREDLKGGSDGS
jgi:hypothetical protein